MRRAFATKPTKMWIDGKCYEIQRFNKRQKTISDTGFEEQRNPQIGKGSSYDYKTNSEGQLFTSFLLPQSYHGKIKIFPHLKLKLLETSTNTTITLEKNVVVVAGASEEGIAEARDTIHSVLVEIRDSVPPLQFISIPTTSADIIENYNKFKAELLSGHQIKGMDETIFPSALKLHLTVVVCTLLDEREKSEAVKALQDYKTTILDPLIQKTGPIKIRVAGIDCMNNNLKNAHVLYAKAQFVDENDDFTLQKLVNRLSDHFYERGLVRTYKDNVKVHMTVINTKYRKSGGQEKKRRVQRKSFDATTIMEKYKDFHFGDCDLSSVHLSLMGQIGEDGFYKPISVINA